MYMYLKFFVFSVLQDIKIFQLVEKFETFLNH